VGKDVLLIRRFDRRKINAGWERFAMVSALTLLGLDEMMARYASYQELATIIRHRFTDPRPTLRELFFRLMFNILCGNTDDHARNHAAFWNGSALSLTPAYDICPQGRTGQEASQAMLIDGDRRFSQIAVCLDAAPSFLCLARRRPRSLWHRSRPSRSNGSQCATRPLLSTVDRKLFWRRQFLNPFAFEGAPNELTCLVAGQS
jgi:serine/threonine-protein kinase HipA